MKRPWRARDIISTTRCSKLRKQVVRQRPWMAPRVNIRSHSKAPFPDWSAGVTWQEARETRSCCTGQDTLPWLRLFTAAFPEIFWLRYQESGKECGEPVRRLFKGSRMQAQLVFRRRSSRAVCWAAQASRVCAISDRIETCGCWNFPPVCRQDLAGMEA